MTISTEDATDLVRSAFDDAGYELASFEVKRYPEETIFVVSVAPSDLERAAEIGNAIDRRLAGEGFDGFVTVRRALESAPTTAKGALAGVHDPRATELLRLLQARSRTSESQPSLSYVRDTAASLAKATAPRHHLIFGRRGAGKTALLVEAKRQVEAAGEAVVWINMQPHRWQPIERTALSVMKEITDAALLFFSETSRAPSVAKDADRISSQIFHELGTKAPSIDAVRRLVPSFQSFLRRFVDTTGRDLFLFLDDFYFVPRKAQVELLDVLHASVRDTRAWLKIASIRHLTRWFDPSHQVGLQLGHDADSIDLDVTLQDPARAKTFLEEVLRSHATKVGVTSITRLYSTSALDRLVLASGSVPRDYLLLAANSILKAQERPNAKLVGVQDVNRAAGDAAQIKIQELDEDLSEDSEWAQQARDALERLRAFCLDEKRYTYFRIAHRDKEDHHDAYDAVASLMDLRLIHLLNPAVSDEKKAGVRYEAYLLDLSQYSGDRLRKNIHVLDFDGGHLVQKETGHSGSDRIGDTARKLLQILRRGPEFPLISPEF